MSHKFGVYSVPLTPLTPFAPHLVYFHEFVFPFFLSILRIPPYLHMKTNSPAGPLQMQYLLKVCDCF